MEAAMKKEAETVCVLCCQEIDVFAVGKCDHPVCYRCSTKMRVLCEQKYCAVCRVELDKVIFVRELRPFAALSPHELQTERKYDIYFADRTIFALFRKILLCECLQCPEPKVFSKFEELEQHMRKQHELFCCKLCAKHLKLFSYERKWYNRKELARHRTHGDPDDTSHRGHPLCKFCDDRYLDNDELLKHLRRDHYFCHFCDADGAQEYYCDYRDLSDHFRESHFLCEEGRCRTEQFTHAFRTEIDYKAHKAAAHSKNRAEARQNRQIDIQFNYAPRQQRRNDGLVSADDYEEVDRFNRQGRSGRGRPQGLHQNVRSWRYNREEEDKDLAAAILASQAARRQTERGGQVHERGGQVHERGGQVHERGGQVHERGGQVHERGGQVHERGGQVHERGGQVHERGGQVHERGGQVHERGGQKPRKEEPVEGDELRVNRGAVKPHSDMQGRSTNNNVPLMGEDFPVLGAGAPPLPIHNMVKPNPVSLKEDDFPSLVHSGTTSSARMTPAYVPQARKHSSFQEEDFPALVSKIRPHKPQENTTSAWSQVGSKSSMLNNNKPVVLPTKTYSHTAPVFSASDPPPSSAVPQTHGSRRKKVTSLQSTKATSKGKSLLSSDDEDPQGGKMFQENRAVPTMLDISSLLTVKTGSSLPSNKNGRKKKQPSATPSGTNVSNLESVTTAAHKENVPETKPPDGSVPKSTGAPKSNKFINGYKERPKETKDTILPEEPPAPKKQPCSEAPAALEEEDFPALTTKKPPPGFKSTFSMKNIQTQLPPPPPPGLGPVISKPPPGFTGVPLDSNVTEYTVPVFNRPAASLGTYHMPENFNQRNIDLIQSIQNFLQNDESKFNEFKNYSGQFRQGLMSAAQYHKSCHELLGENFSRVFNELLVLLPDTQKQQELLTAHADFKATEKQQPGSKGKKNKKKAWQTCTNTNSLDLDCQVCPTCRQVLAPKDFSAHMSLHNGDDDFPSLQAVSKIIS